MLPLPNAQTTQFAGAIATELAKAANSNGTTTLSAKATR